MTINTDNASGAGMETVGVAEHMAGANRFTMVVFEAMRIPVGTPLVRRTDASRLLAEKEGRIKKLESALKAIEGADSWLYAINTAHDALKP